MIKILIFTIIAIVIFALTFAKLIKENDTNYIYELGMEFIGIAINFICIFLEKTPNIFVYILMWILSIVLPIILIILEKRNIHITEIICLIKIKIKKDEIKKILLDAIEEYPNSYILHKRLALYYEENNEIEKAEDEYLESIKIQPKDYQSYYKLAELFHSNKKNEESIQLLESLLQIKPDYLQGSLLLGNIFYENEQFKEAINVYNSALKYSPSKYEIYYSLGMTYTRLNDFNNAKDCYKKAATINSLRDISNLNLGQINLIFRDYDEAEKYFYEGIKSDDDKIVANSYYYLAKIKMFQNNMEQAVLYCNIAIDIFPNIIKRIEIDDSFSKILGKLKVKTNKEIKTKTTEKENEIIEYLGQTYNVVEKLTDNFSDNVQKIDRER